MHCARTVLAWALIGIAVVGFDEAIAHNGGILIQEHAGQLVTGFDNETSGQQTIGDRAFSLLFPSALANDVPSFLSLSNAPAGSNSLPAGTTVFWDFLPMHIGGLTSNLLYWDGQGSTLDEVEFGPLTQRDVSLALFTQGFADSAQVEGTPTMVPGREIGTTTSDSVALHAHRWFSLNANTVVPEGVYLAALQLRSDGYRNTEPFYIAAATDEVSAATLDNLALAWVADAVDWLILDGDYDFSGDVRGADMLAWQRQLGFTGPFPHDDVYTDGDRNGVVDDGDGDVWQANFGNDAETLANPPAVVWQAAVPEPTALVLIAIGIAAVGFQRRTWHFG